MDSCKQSPARTTKTKKNTHTQTLVHQTVSNSKTNHGAYNQIRIRFAFVDALLYYVGSSERKCR